MKKTDVLIIGAGVAGLSAALYLARAHVNLIIVDKGAPGGKLLTIPTIENYPGAPAMSGLALAQSFLESASRFGVQVEYSNIQNITSTLEGFLAKSESETYQAKAIIVASGLSFVPTIKGEKEFFAKGVSYCATCDGRFYKNKDVMVYGHEEEAGIEALYLSSLAKTVYLYSPQDFIMSTSLMDSLKKLPNVKMKTKQKILSINGDNHVHDVSLETGSLPIEGIFPLEGEKAASAFLAYLPIKFNKSFLVVNEEMVTSVPGVFGAGDIVEKKLRQVVTAASDGAIASSSVINYLRKK